jgi:capsular polysaccharide transport system permease protein
VARSSLQIMRDTVHALLMRELKTRFGSSKLGYFWALAEPAAQASVLAIIFSLIGRSSLSGVPVAVFMLVALIPFKFFSKLLPQLSASVEANKGLLAYRQVSPLDPFIARLLIEVATFIMVYIILMGILAWLGFDVWPYDLLELITASALLILLATGLGLLLCNAVVYWKDTTKLLNMVTTPMMLISGIFYTATMIPSQYWYLFSWNPLFHIIELSRDAMFVSYVTPVGDAYYVAFLALIFNAVGLMLYQVNKRRFIAS